LDTSAKPPVFEYGKTSLVTNRTLKPLAIKDLFYAKIIIVRVISNEIQGLTGEVSWSKYQ
jgi:hypothetical protein